MIKNVKQMKIKMFESLFVFLFILNLDAFAKEDEKITISNDSFPFSKVEYILGNKLDVYVEKFSAYDRDWEKLEHNVLFSNEPELELPEDSRIYNYVDNIALGGQIADIYFLNKRHYKDSCTRFQTEYKNLFIYYYCIGSSTDDFLFLIGISRHTGETVFSFGYKYYQYFEPLNFSAK